MSAKDLSFVHIFRREGFLCVIAAIRTVPAVPGAAVVRSGLSVHATVARICRIFADAHRAYWQTSSRAAMTSVVPMSITAAVTIPAAATNTRIAEQSRSLTGIHTTAGGVFIAKASSYLLSMELYSGAGHRQCAFQRRIPSCGIHFLFPHRAGKHCYRLDVADRQDMTVLLYEKQGWELVCKQGSWLWFRKMLDDSRMDSEYELHGEERHAIADHLHRLIRPLDLIRNLLLIAALILILIPGGLTSDWTPRIAALPLFLCILPVKIAENMRKALGEHKRT